MFARLDCSQERDETSNNSGLSQQCCVCRHEMGVGGSVRFERCVVDSMQSREDPLAAACDRQVLRGSCVRHRNDRVGPTNAAADCACEEQPLWQRMIAGPGEEGEVVDRHDAPNPTWQ